MQARIPKSSIVVVWKRLLAIKEYNIHQKKQIVHISKYPRTVQRKEVNIATNKSKLGRHGFDRKNVRANHEVSGIQHGAQGKQQTEHTYEDAVPPERLRGDVRSGRC